MAMRDEPTLWQDTDAELEQARERLLAHQDDHQPHYYPVLPTISDDRPLLGQYERPDPVYGAIPPTNRAANRSQRKRDGRSRRKRYRLPFLILLTFDWGLIVFLSIICAENPLSDDDPDDRTSNKYFIFDIYRSYFDLVVLATLRLVFCVLFYLVLEWVTRIIMTFTTLVSALYVPIKAYYIWKQLTADDLDQSIPMLLILFVAFVMPWFVAFFFEFKYLPAELERLYIPTWKDPRAWFWPRALRREEESESPAPSLPEIAAQRQMQLPHHYHGYMARSPRAPSSLSLDFRTPVGSIRASPVHMGDHGEDDLPPIREEDPPLVELHAPECDQKMSPEDLRLMREADVALEGYEELTKPDIVWTLEKTTQDGTKCYSKQGKKRKIFKGEIVIDIGIQQLWNVLYPGDLTSEWNPHCASNEVVYRVDEVVDVVYTVTNAVGPVSSRDFVSVRKIAVKNGCYYAASMATTIDIKPPQPGKVRAENGPCGFLLIPVDTGHTKFISLINSDLKGWLPQAVIDQSVSGTLVTSLQKLHEYINQLRSEGRL